jgi:hypothetical protein
LIIIAIALIIAIFTALCAYFSNIKVSAAIVTVIFAIIGTISLRSTNEWALYLILAGFGFPYLLAAIFAGGLAASFLKKGKYVKAVLPFLPFLILILYFRIDQQNKKQEAALALEYVSQHPKLRKFAGKQKFVLSSTTGKHVYEYTFKNPGPNPEFLSAIVQADPSSGTPHFSLKCVTDKFLGQRSPMDRICSQGIIDLPE